MQHIYRNIIFGLMLLTLGVGSAHAALYQNYCWHLSNGTPCINWTGSQYEWSGIASPASLTLAQIVSNIGNYTKYAPSICYANGTNCPIGYNGTDGINGTNGINGTDGSDGDDGDDGDPGPQGPPGINGTNASVTSGHSYINITNGEVTANITAFDERYYPRKTNPQGFYNITTLPAYPAGDNTSWNETRANALYSPIGSGGNTSFNQSLTDGLYYPRNTNPQGFYNVSTLPAYPTGDNTSWNESRANSLYTTPAYVSSAVGANLTLSAINTNMGNYSANSAGYTTLAAVNTNMGNWSKDKSTLPNLTYGQISTNLGNWSADKASYATLAQLNAGANLTYALINTNMGNWSKDKSTLPNLTYAQITTNIGNFSANGYTKTYIDTLGNASKHVATCAVGTVIQNITATGIQCVVDTTGTGGNASFNQSLTDGLYYPRNTNPQGFYNVSTLPAGGGDNTSWNQTAYWTNASASFAPLGTGGNTSWNESLATTLYYPRNTNPQGFYNVSTLPAYPVADNTSWNESRANSLYTTPSYVSGAVGANLTLAAINTNMGNASKLVGTCADGTVVMNITATGVQCAAAPVGSVQLSTETITFVNRTTINQTVTGQTLANITGLEFLAKANTNYTVECTIRYRSNTTTNGLSLAVEDWGGTVSSIFGAATITGVAATTQNSGTFLATNTKVTSTAVAAVNTIYPSYFKLNILNGATPVTITPQFSAEVANLNTTIAQGSFCIVTYVDVISRPIDNTSFNQSLTDTLYYPRNTNPSGFYNSTTLPATAYQSSAAGWTNTTTVTSTTLNVNITTAGIITSNNGSIINNATCIGFKWADGTVLGAGTQC